MENQSASQKGFALIALLITVAIIGILIALYYGKPGSQKSAKQAGDKAIEQTKQNNQTQINQQIEMQNELNSIGN